MSARPPGFTAGRRFSIATVVGAVVGGVSMVVAPWQMAVAIGWDTAAALLVVWVWTTVWPMTPAETATAATGEDSSRSAADLLLLSAAMASLVGVGLVLVKSSQAHGLGEATLVGAGVVTVMLSWTVVHTVFALRYAHQYYDGDDGGVDFNHPDRPPDYRDFAYLAFTVGMTFQVSDTNINAPRIRATVLRHALLSYVFGAVIVAVMINIVAGLANH